MGIETILLILGLICFGAAAVNVATGRVNLVALGLLLVFLRDLL